MAALAAHASALAIRHDADVHVDGPQERLPLSADAEERLFRIGQEAMTNAVKHSGSATVSAQVTVESERVSLAVRDQGTVDGVSERAQGRRAAGPLVVSPWVHTPEGAVVGAQVELEDVGDASGGQLVVEALVVVDEVRVRVLGADVEAEEGRAIPRDPPLEQGHAGMSAGIRVGLDGAQVQGPAIGIGDLEVPAPRFDDRIGLRVPIAAVS
ncbi:MAG: hypothetical protein ACRDPM_15595 [Solirubrobacteraceae bacterium]